jgi:hypothetical protein
MIENTKWSDYGESSLTIVSFILGIEKESPSIPRDPSDFRRCVHLFDCLDYHKHKVEYILLEMSEVYPIWKGIAENWKELMKLYDEEKDQKTAPKLYDHLKKLQGDFV